MPVNNDPDVDAAVFALGVPEGEDRAALLREVATREDFQAEVELWQMRLAQLETGRDTIQPDPADWEMISRRLGFSTTGTRLAREREGIWVSYEPGVDIKFLQVDPTSALRTALLRMEPGAISASHQHEQTEYCVVIDGDVMLDDHRLVKGDLHIAPAGTMHSTISTKGGCLLLLRWDPQSPAMT
jgi:anti-sigma factor ChrR (cupin superfamily)